jgi:hypothetical protein
MNSGCVVVAAAVDAIAVADEKEVVGNNAVLGDVDGAEPE